MSARRLTLRCIGVLTLGSATAGTLAQSPDPIAAAAQAPPVELPPLIVAESAVAPLWLYARVNGTEYLSRCSESTTRRYADGWEHALQLLWTIVPDSLLSRSEIPAITVLYSQKLSQVTSPELLRELKQQRVPSERLGVPDYIGQAYYSFAPNMRLNDRDLYVTFSYVDETNFDASHLSAAPEYLRFLLERRVPALPAWFIEGVDEIYRDANFASNGITLRRFFWVDSLQTHGLMRDVGFPRALLSASELFAPDALRGRINGNVRRVETMKSEVALFVRWALESGPSTREALWQFATRAAEQPASEKMFESCFGFGYAELRDRLSDYLPQALQETPRVDAGKLPRVPRVAVRTATPNEVARLRGEWERLAVGFVQNGMPHLQERYVEQARRTMHRVFDAGDRDPRLLATMGLCELAAGEMSVARSFLEPATAAGVMRPRAYYELARLRFAELRRDQPPAKLFTATELGPVLELLRIAARQKPLLPETFFVLGDVLGRSSTAPSAEDIALLEVGARAFARRPDVNFQLALALARHGKSETAAALLAAGIDYVADDATRVRFIQLRESLTLPH